MIIKMDTRSIVRAAFRQKWKFILTFVPIISLAVTYILLATPIYMGSAKLLIQFGQDARPEIQLNRNQNLTAEEKRGLIQSNINILRSRDLIEELLKGFSLTDIYPELSEIDNEERRMNAAISRYLTDLQTPATSNAGIIDVIIYHSDDQIALVLLERHVSLFIKSQTLFFSNPQADVIREQTEKALADLERGNRAILDFKDRTGVTSIDEEISILLNKRSDISEYLTTYEGNSDLLMPLPAKKDVNPNNVPFPALDEAQRRIDELRAQEQEMLLTYKPDSQVVRKIRQNIQAETKSLQSSIQTLQDKVTELDERITQMNIYKSEYDILRRNVELKESAYERALARMQAAEVNDDLNKRNITQIALIETPSVSVKPVRPNKKLLLLLGLVIASCLAGGLVIVSELLDTRIIAADQITHLFKVPLLSDFMKLRSFRRRYRCRLPVNQLEFLIQEMEASTKDKKIKVLSLSSCNLDEGTTTIAFNLANYLSINHPEQKILVIDDSRHTQFESIELSAEEAFASKPAFEPSVYTLSFGRHKNQIINEETFKVLQKNFDMVIITASNLMNDPISTRINSLADVTAFVLEAEKTRYPVVAEAIKRIERNNINLIGFILNKKHYYIPKWMYKFIK